MNLRLLIALLVLANVASAVAVVYARHQHRQLFVELTRLEKVRDELNIEFGRLQLEQATWAESNRIDQIARKRLGMQFPQADAIVVVRP
jgi:cell division protein FtsL